MSLPQPIGPASLVFGQNMPDSVWKWGLERGEDQATQSFGFSRSGLVVLT